MARPNLAELAKAGGGTRTASTVVESHDHEERRIAAKPSSRQSTVPITVQQPGSVRTQLKMLALEQSDTLENKVAEAFNDLFAKYAKPEIAVVKLRKGRG